MSFIKLKSARSMPIKKLIHRFLPKELLIIIKNMLA